jgi:hypothetical protein
MDELEKQFPPEPVGATAALAGAEGISETPAFQRAPEAPKTLPGVIPSALPVPSLEGLTEMIPGAASALASVLTRSPAITAAAGSGGEAVRMALRKLMGFAPATGLAQETLGLDPNSPEAMLTNLVTEGVGGGATEAASKFAAKSAAPALRRSAAKSYASIFGPKTEAIHKEVAGKLEPILDDLPVGSRTRINRVSGERAEQAGKRVGDIYNVDTPASFKPVRDKLDELATGQIRRPEHTIARVDPQTGQVEWIDIPADIKNPKLHRALTSRADAMGKADKAATTSGVPTTLQDLFEARKAADEMATEKTFALGKKSKDVLPAPRALKAERAAISKEMHDITGSLPNKPGKGEVADAIYSAWKTVETGTKGTSGSGSFIERWILARALPGLYGTAAGAVAAKPAFWKSLSASAKLGISNALKTGDDAAAMHLLRTSLDNYGKTEPKEQ